MLKKLSLVAVAVSAVAAANCGQPDDSSSDPQLVQGALCTPTALTPIAAVSSGTPKQPASRAIDGNTGTRWESQFSDPQWIYVDLGAVKTVTEVKIDWQRASAKDYRIDVSNDAVNWSAPVVTRTGMPAVDHRIDDLTGFSVSARYVRMYGTARANQYGYSIWEMYVYDGTSCGGTGAAGAGGTGAAGTGAAGTGAAGTGAAGSGSGGTCASNSLTTSTTLVATATSGTALRAFDNNAGTRWESAFSDPQSITVDLGARKKVNRVLIVWETASAKNYKIQLSDNNVSFTDLVTKTNMPTGKRTDDLTGLSGAGRYVRMSGTLRTTQYGYSIWEMDVFGDNNPGCGGGTGAAGAGGAGGTGAAGAGGSSSTTCASGSLVLSGAVASSTTQAASRAIDGSTSTRWETAAADPQWIYVDLGSRKAVRQVKIDWETASAAAYEIDVSDDAAVWSPIVKRSGLGSTNHRIDDTLGTFGAGRYVRIFGTQRTTQFGYSIWELTAFGDSNPACGNLLTAGWNHGTVAATFSPLAGFAFDAAKKNKIAFDYTGQSFTTPGTPQLIEFTQAVTIPKAGTQWRVTLDVTGMNDQAGLPPHFTATLDGIPVTTYLPGFINVASSGGQLIKVGSLSTGAKLIMDFSVSLAANATVELVLTNVPIFSLVGAGTSGTGLQRFTVGDVTLERLDLN